MIAILFFLLILGIFIATLLAFIYSLICFGYSGSSTDKIIGLIIAWLFGQFYWIYYMSNNNYCKSKK